MPPRKAEGADRILKAATMLFEQQGYRATTLDDIARAAGMAKPTVYQHVGSKAEMLETIFARVLNRMDENFTALEHVDDPLVQITTFVRSYVESVVELQPYYRIFFNESRELPARTKRRFGAWSEQMTDRIVRLVTVAQQEGVVRAEIEPRLVVYLVVGMLSSISRWYRPGVRSTDQIVDQLAIVLGNVVAPGHDVVAAMRASSGC